MQGLFSPLSSVMRTIMVEQANELEWINDDLSFEVREGDLQIVPQTPFPRPFRNATSGCAGTEQLDMPDKELVPDIPRPRGSGCARGPRVRCHCKRSVAQIQHATAQNQRMTIETAGDFRPVWPEDDKRSAPDRVAANRGHPADLFALTADWTLRSVRVDDRGTDSK
jgi:hypothetical protein